MRNPVLLFVFFLTVMAITPGAPEGRGLKSGDSHVLAELSGGPFCTSCTSGYDKNVHQLDRKPHIEPDYVDVTIPPNIAPLNFFIREDGNSYSVTATSGSKEYQLELTSSDGFVRFPENSWRELFGGEYW